MVFCTQCGIKALDEHRFCAKCGAPITPPTEITEEEIVKPTQDSSLENSQKSDTLSNISWSEDTVDRKTLFDDGMLILTSRDIILYTSDEKQELKRISIPSIESCSYSSIRHGLAIKYRVNEDNNLEDLLTQWQIQFADIKSKKQFHEEELKQAKTKASKNELKKKMKKLEDQMYYLDSEIKQLKSNPAKIKDDKKNIVDTKKEIFRLPKTFDAKHTAREEFRIWEYAINRRTKGISQVKINTKPYNAIVTINRRIVGTTPLTIDIPLIDDAVLEGKYHVTVMKEGFETASFSIPAELGQGSVLEEFEMYERENQDTQTDQLIAEMRENVRDRSIDLSSYPIEREIKGKNDVLLLTEDEILVMDKDKKQCLFDIPYGTISESKYERGLLKNKAVKVTYNERNFRDQSFEFWIDDNGGKITSSEIKQRSESLVEFLDKKRKESKILALPKRLHSPNYFVVTETDIKNNFSRFEPFEFERLVARLFEKKGYKTTVTRKTGDFGVDVIAEAGNEKIAIQVKHWQAPVGGPDVHKTLGSMITYGANRAMVVTTSDFASQAYEIQKRGAPIELWNGSRIRDEFRQYLLEAIKEARNTK